ncbi:MAG: aldo/keto reductase, partial [Planctomycetes bacterium]|nr:aldo/keto reductase [Planctomycetota bacterium]
GCWQMGADWGEVSDDTAFAIMKTAVDQGVTFFDTADVYGNGRSETLIGRFLKQTTAPVCVATKFGRTVYPDAYTEQAMREGVDASLQRLGVEALDLVQLHCIPMAVMQDGRVFDWLRQLKRDGKILNFGASVESVDEAMVCMVHEDLASLQIIFNCFRQKSVQTLLPQAKANDVGIIVRLPLASGLLAGKMSPASTFADSDHRHYNRDGQCFNVGETFAGLRFEKGVALADKLKAWVPDGMTLAQMAMRWILDHEAVSVLIPGASRPEQATDNAKTSCLSPLSQELHEEIRNFYVQEVHSHIRGPY